MAAAACSSRSASGTNNSSGGRTPHEQRLAARRRQDSRRRQAALSFLSSISLDGRPLVTTQPVNAHLEVAERPCPQTVVSSVQLMSPELGHRVPSTGNKDKFGFSFPLSPVTPAPLAKQSLPIGNHVVQPTPGLGGGSLSLGIDVPLQRPRHISGSPKKKHLKKVHFIRNMRQYDTKNSRIVLICAKRSLCAAFSVLPYGQQVQNNDIIPEGQALQHPSGVATAAGDATVLGLEGVEMGGADGKTVSYARFLFPTNALVTPKGDCQGTYTQSRTSVQRNFPHAKYSSGAGSSETGGELGETVHTEYNPDVLDDPQWPCGKHKRVLIFASYMTTLIEYVKPSDLKKDMNETFKEKFPHIKLTLSKIRSLKREIKNVALECNLEPRIVAVAYVYFEKLILQGKVNKQNRKLCAAACMLLAAKIGSDLKKQGVKNLIDKLEERFRLNRRELIAFEFAVLVALEMALYLPENQVLPHYRRLCQLS
ncbi:CDK5 and ABL1 enzyme substrate 2 [Protopterus annectens]|uniref:CDK5 and ABL1 enzyme substrate 2 n=1 Tax=Protopterus annectens TaxID=7888 RepID=UPI001CFAACA9|nr:CDK5 and ABL1 enzyme substrate 2 [Protopterus annectens]